MCDNYRKSKCLLKRLILFIPQWIKSKEIIISITAVNNGGNLSGKICQLLYVRWTCDVSLIIPAINSRFQIVNARCGIILVLLRTIPPSPRNNPPNTEKSETTLKFVQPWCCNLIIIIFYISESTERIVVASLFLSTDCWGFI